ncbi:MAG: hypothetical protein FWB74_01710 [Defluviitaleaceae bacterium]|nr:hypothetical protein [Defluviitaleaceae bacterium]
MKVKVVVKHDGEGTFPTFPAGASVDFTGEECSHFLGWRPCAIEGHDTYVPLIYVNDKKLIKDYNPTELVQDVNDVLYVQEIVHAWLVAANENGAKGWIPAESVISV